MKLLLFLCSFNVFCYSRLIRVELAAKSASVLLGKKASNVTTTTPPPLPGEVFVERLTDHLIKYTGRVSVGSPPQFFDVVFDTGSEIFWLPGFGAHYTIPGRAMHFGLFNGTYNVLKSRTAQDTGFDFNLNYAVGHAKGIQIADFVTLGQHGTLLKFPQRLRLGVAQELSFTTDGILGLGFPRDSSESRGTNFISEAFRRNLFEKPIFTTVFKICNEDDCRRGGQITFGGEDTKNCAGEIGRVDVVPLHFDRTVTHWAFMVDSLKIEDHILPLKEELIAVTDTGSNVIMLPEWLLYKVASKIPVEKDIIQRVGDGRLIIKTRCNANFTLTFSANNVDVKLHSKNLLPQNPIKPDGFCYLNISSSERVNFALLGTPFMREYCIVHDFEKRQIGFAKLKD